MAGLWTSATRLLLVRTSTAGRLAMRPQMRAKVGAGAKANSAPLPPLSRLAPDDGDQRRRAEDAAGDEGKGRAEAVPQQPGQGAGDQQRNATGKVEKAVGRAAQIGRRGIGDHRREQALGHAQVQAPEDDAEPDREPVAVPGQRRVRRNQHHQPCRQQPGWLEHS